MRIPFFLLCIGLFALGGCGGESISSRPGLPPVITEPFEVEVGEKDPLADARAQFGGEYTTWGGGFPRALNYWLDFNALAGQVCGLMFEPLVSLHPVEARPIGAAARGWQILEDGMVFEFEIHPAATWSDGVPVTAEDFQFYYDVIMNPRHLTSPFRVELDRLERPEVLDEKRLRVRAKTKHWSSFWSAGGLVAFPKHVWQDKDFNEITFDFPVVSGPYKIREVLTNRSVTLERRGDYWGRVLPINQHKYNFDYLRWRFMEDRHKALEALKKGDFDLYPIYTAAIWVEQTHFPAVEKGWVVRQEIFNHEPKGFQGFGMNLRRPLFQDLRVRKALAHLLNREQMLEKLMYNQYFLMNSYFPDLFEDNMNPKAPFLEYNPEKARDLLKTAGWEVDGTGRLAKDGEPFRISFLHHGETFPHLNIYMQDLQRVGIEARVETVTPATYSKRIDEHQFDMGWFAWGAGRLRDPEASWSSKTARDIATVNVTGFANPEVDRLIDSQKEEPELEKRNEILRQIDDVLTREVPYVLLWQKDRSTVLYWNKFGRPAHPFGKYSREDAAVVYWWFDKEKAEALEAARRSGASLALEPEVVKFQQD